MVDLSVLVNIVTIRQCSSTRISSPHGGNEKYASSNSGSSTEPIINDLRANPRDRIYFGFETTEISKRNDAKRSN